MFKKYEKQNEGFERIQKEIMDLCKKQGYELTRLDVSDRFTRMDDDKTWIVELSLKLPKMKRTK